MNSEKFSTEKGQQKFCIPPEAWTKLECDETDDTLESEDIVDVSENNLIACNNKTTDNGLNGDVLPSGQCELKCKYKRVSTDSLRPFEPHPFKVMDDDEMQRLIEDIRTHGVLDEIIVRPIISKEGEYEIICGHRRKYACDKLGIKQIPAKICRLDDHEAASLMLYSNLSQRKSLLPSEKAKAYKLEFELHMHQGKKGQGHTSDIIGRKTGDSPSTVKRLRKIAELPDKFLNLIDQKKLGLWQAYILATAELDIRCADVIYDVIINNKSAMTKVQTEQLKDAYLNNNLTTEVINQIMAADEHKKTQEIRLNAERIYEYLPRSYSIRQIEDAICLALGVWNDQTKDV